MLNISQKKELVKRLNKKLSDAEISILVDYKGIDVENINILRSKLRQEGVTMEVVKNTLLYRASKGTDCELLNDHYIGPNAIVVSEDDPVAPAKILMDFAKDNKNLEIKVGVLKGQLIEGETIKALAKMPSRDELLAKLLSTMNEVPASFVRVIGEVPRSLVNVLNAVKDQKDAA